jgi:membrane protease YdiL (CAAX protease family)
MLVIGLFVLALGGLRGSSSTRESEDEFQKTYVGDWMVKAYLFQLYTAKHGAPSDMAERYLEQALKIYRSALAGNPTPDVIRRTGIVSYAAQDQDASEVLDMLDSPKVLKGKPAQDVRDLRSEARMWREIYGGDLNPDHVNEYDARIKGLHLGPVQWLALYQLYTAAGKDAVANRVIADAESRAAASMVLAGVVLTFVALAGLLGVVFIILFIVNCRRWVPASQPQVESSPGVEQGGNGTGDLSDTLFKAFVVYLSTFWALSIISVLFIGPKVRQLPEERELLCAALVPAAGTAVSGALALFVLYVLLRRSGHRLNEIGLTLRDFKTNVLWGIAGYCALLPVLTVMVSIWYVLSRTVLRGVQTPVHPVIPMFASGDRLVVVMVLVAGVIFAPFFEEIFFRGVLYRALRTRLKVPWAVLTSATAFAIMHPFPAGFLPILAIGSVFAVLAETRRSLVPSMVAHAIHNSLTFLIVYLLYM